ncbi:MAG TPA: hypothetical protein DEF82_08810 [Crocinitomicaceae bacterium]|nr:PKD domain-containing protein [Flavobacteriales bacterium]HBW86818.1 hypothetical protein [Crocinitomicaceae bacterium]
MAKQSVFLLTLLLLSNEVLSQLTTNTGQAPNSLVQNVLLGTGVTVSNVLYNGSPTAIGSFTANGTNLGINQGIVMTTGTVFNNGNGPQGPNNQPGCGIDNSVGGSALLSNIIGSTQTYNASILEFDFVPFSDTVRFKYVFGSDEYPEFAPPNNSSYNDVFGFFISGPGISGIQNIARLPNNGSVVSINNVNAITNSQFFNFNGDGNSAPYNSSPFYIQYDGFTDVLEAISSVQCGQTYHLIIAVADVGDGQWDSGIFLEANSLTSITPISITHQISNQLFTNPNWMAEGCVFATVELTRNSNFNTSLTIPIVVSGSATSGIDYTGVPSSVTFSPGQSNLSFTVNSLADLINEGLENLQITFQLQDPCGNLTPQTVELFINDVQPLSVNLNNPTIECPGDEIQITASISGGLPPYSYLWSDGSIGTGITVSPNTTEIYWVAVNESCTNSSTTDSVLISVPIFNPITIELGDDINVICPYLEDTLYASISGGSGSFSIQWKKDNSIILGANTAELPIKPAFSSTYIAIATDNCGNSISDTISYNIMSPPLIVNTSPNIEICPGDSVYISAQVSGGYGSISYHWLDLEVFTSGVWVKPEFSTAYYVEVSDECQTFSVISSVQVTIVKPSADFEVSTEEPMLNLPTCFQNLSNNAISYSWDFGDGNTSSLIHPNHVYSSSGNYLVTLIATDEKGCIDSIKKPIKIFEEFYFYLPNSFSPNNDNINDVFYGNFIGMKSIEISIFNRWGELIYSSENLDFSWDGTFKDKQVPIGTYTWMLKYKRNGFRNNLIVGHVNLIR